MDLVTGIGLAAAFCTTAANFPQLKKAWRSGSTDDLSVKMLSLLATGLTLWLIYGVFRKDMVIILANTASLVMVLAILYFKLRDMWKGPRDAKAEGTA
jgi:MtN3 and saliva related transmembrane protein